MKTKIILETPEIDKRPIYITGDFNSWNPADPAFELRQTNTSVYEIEIEHHQDFEYKFTKGGWQHVEIDRHGNKTPNRKCEKEVTEKKELVERWRDNWAPFKQEFFPIIEKIDDEFEIPQLNKKRRVWALLPHNYYTTNKRYPVLYLQDAQNLFNEGSEYGNWEIDKKMSVLAEYSRGDVIIIAVEHGGENRLKEYIFENNVAIEQGEGKKYIRFVTDTLKVFIDKNYRTLPERDHTGIGGSSLGGLISIYGGFLYPEVYSKLMIFSPSLWVVPTINFPMISFYNPFKTKLYIYGGEKEGDEMVERIQTFQQNMEQYEHSGKDLEFKISINPEGEHSEYYWSQEFPKAIEWLFFNSDKNPLEFENKS